MAGLTKACPKNGKGEEDCRRAADGTYCSEHQMKCLNGCPSAYLKSEPC